MIIQIQEENALSLWPFVYGMTFSTSANPQYFDGVHAGLTELFEELDAVARKHYGADYEEMKNTMEAQIKKSLAYN